LQIGTVTEIIRGGEGKTAAPLCKAGSHGFDFGKERASGCEAEVRNCIREADASFLFGNPRLKSMATYVYETVPQKRGEKPRQFEFVQKMSDPPLTHHPETGEPIRRVIIGGSGNIMRGTSILSMNNPRRGR
jgi:predicted nucleic acid-binding Zn ribbon protein